MSRHPDEITEVRLQSDQMYLWLREGKVNKHASIKKIFKGSNLYITGTNKLTLNYTFFKILIGIKQ